MHATTAAAPAAVTAGDRATSAFGGDEHECARRDRGGGDGEDAEQARRGGARPHPLTTRSSSDQYASSAASSRTLP